MAARPRRTERSKALRLSCFNAHDVGGRKHELDHFLNQHGVDICLLSEKLLNPGQAFRLANYVCHRTDKPTTGGGTAILVRRDIVHHSARFGPDPLGGYCHSSHIGRQTGENPRGLHFAFPPTYRSGPDSLFRRCIAGPAGRRPRRQTRGLNSRLSTRRGELLRDYADENSCLIFGPDTQSTNPYNPSATPYVLDIVTTQNLSSPVYYFVLALKLGPPPGTH